MTNKRKPRHKATTMSLNDLFLFHDMCEALLEDREQRVLPEQYKRVVTTLAPLLRNYEEITVRFKGGRPCD